MSLIVPDFWLIAKIANTRSPKTTHRWPSGRTANNDMCAPKMSIDSRHSVYEHARHGSHGNPNEPPLVMVHINDIWAEWPYEWQDEDMPAEGFASVESYGQWWDVWRAGKSKNCKVWDEMWREPFWVAQFQLVGVTQYFEGRLGQYVNEVQRY